MSYALFVSCPKGLEYLLAEELQSLGLKVDKISPQGVTGQADLSLIYHIALWSRLANRLHLILFSGQAHNQQTLYNLCSQFHWQTVFSADKTFAIEFHGTSEHIRNTMFGAQVIKDSIVDHFQKLQNTRPSVDKERAQIRIQAHLKNGEVTISYDLVGYSLHQRGYRTQAGEAPLKENIAAAMLLRCKWPELASQGYALYDPFCGSGTLVIEAAMMAAQIAPGLLRTDQSFADWVGHQPSLWEKMRQQALAQVKPTQASIVGSDSHFAMISIAQDNANRAGVAPLVSFKQKELKDCQASQEKGLLVGNPPYGERLSEETHLIPLYQTIGTVLHTHFQGWQAGIITDKPMLAKAIGLRAEKQYHLYNGKLACILYTFSLNEQNKLKNNQAESLSAGAQMFANRLKKNKQHLTKWAKREVISCYRIYDADLPEYAFAIDVYEDWAVLQEYAAPASILPHLAAKRALEVMQVVPAVLEIPAEHLIIKQRRQQKGQAQYEKLKQQGQYLTVQEGRAKFKVNLQDYLDTGLFLDHRPLRLRFAQLTPGTRFLNCFCYTATASVHAALAGAKTTNVDMSNTYLNWAQDNFKLNHLDPRDHQFLQEDCTQWLKTCRDRFDVIFLDPPSFSNSKRMKGTLDVFRDQAFLIEAALRLLKPEGLLYFSTNLRHFKLSPEINQKYQVRDISKETIDVDFKRNQRIHQCFIIQL